MSDQQKEFLEEYDKRLEDFNSAYKRMRTLLLTLLGVLLTVALSLGAMNIEGVATNKQRITTTEKNVDYIMQNSVSTRAIDRIIVTFETQTKVMEEYLPDDVKGAIQEFNKKSAELRSNIMMFNSNIRGEQK